MYSKIKELYEPQNSSTRQISNGVTNPEKWGPSFWFTLHNGSVAYPVNASPIVQERMLGFINGIPYMLPCESCTAHALAYLDNMDDKLLKDVVKGREPLFAFFVHFHNYVNKRTGKPLWTVEEAKKVYF